MNQQTDQTIDIKDLAVSNDEAVIGGKIAIAQSADHQSQTAQKITFQWRSVTQSSINGENRNESARE